MVIQYAIESIAFHRTQKTANFSDQQILELFVAEPEVLAVCADLDEKTKSIAKSVADASSSRYKKVTLKQKFALAKALLEKFGDIETVIARAFKVSKSEIVTLLNNEMGIDVIEIDADVVIACGNKGLIEMGYTTKQNLPEITYKTSKKLAELIKQKCFNESTSSVCINDRTCINSIRFAGIELNGEVVAVTDQEWRTSKKPDIGFKKVELNKIHLSR